jgi:hypothetical protein
MLQRILFIFSELCSSSIAEVCDGKIFQRFCMSGVLNSEQENFPVIIYFEHQQRLSNSNKYI